MYEDAQTQLWNAAALSATGVSTNAYDQGAAAITSGPTPDSSIGEQIGVILTVGVAAKVSGTTETYEFDVIQADDAALTSNVDILGQYAFTNTQAGTLLKAGSILYLPYPQGSITKRYIGAKFVGANTPTITVTGWISMGSMAQLIRNYGTKIQVL